MEKLKHLNKAAHNEKFFENLNVGGSHYSDWIVVGIFYAVIHYYEAYFALSGKHSGSHHTADNWISTDKRIADTYSDYRELKQSRLHASYQDKIFSDDEIKKNILPKFYNIKSRLLSIR